MAQPSDKPDPAGPQPEERDWKGTQSFDLYSGKPQPAGWKSSAPYQPLPDKDEDDLAKAIQMSLNDRVAEIRQKQNQAVIPSNPSKPSSSAEDASEVSTEIILSMNNAFPNLNALEDDTAIYFGVPPQQPEQTAKEYDYVKKHFDKVHVVNSKTLRLMGEESRFTDNDLLGATKSFRAERRLRKQHGAVLEHAEKHHGKKFKYYIDLRPPKEDEEAIILITELSCTRGILSWYLAKDKYALDPLAVLGHDNVWPPELMANLPSAQPPAPAPAHDSTSDADADDQTSADADSESAKPPPKLAPEYSDLRHHSGLERLLQAIQGNDPKLDSAPKVWTFFALARYFGCAAHERISGWITTWLYMGNNANFIQNNPEVAYRMAMGIRSRDLLKDSFSILVGERALIEAYGEYRSDILSPLRRNVHGRKLEQLDDDERNRIDHAASALVKRVRDITSKMCRDLSFLDKTSYKSITTSAGATSDDNELMKSARQLIKEYVRSRIYYILCQDQKPMASLEHNLASTGQFRSAADESFSAVYQSLNQPMRLFTKTFWTALTNAHFDVSIHNLSSDGTTGHGHDNHYIQGLKELYKDDPVNGITLITRSQLNEKIAAVNRALYSRNVDSGGQKIFPSSSSDASRVQQTNYAEDDEYRPAVASPFRYSESTAGLEQSSPLTVRNPTEIESSEVSPNTSPAKRQKTSDTESSFSSKVKGLLHENFHHLLPGNKKVTFNASLSIDKDEETSPQTLSYGNPSPTKPSWTTKESPVGQSPENRRTGTMKNPQNLSLRPKATPKTFSLSNVGVSHPLNASDDKPGHASSGSTLAESARLHSAKAASGVGYAEAKWGPVEAVSASTGSKNETIKSLFDPEAPAGQEPPNMLSEWLPTVKDESESHDSKENNQTDLIDLETTSKDEINPNSMANNLPLRPSTNRPVIKQAFSNSNTPDYYGSKAASSGPKSGSEAPWTPKKLAALTPDSVSSDKNTNLMHQHGYYHYPISTGHMLKETSTAIGDICSSMLYPNHLFHETGLLPTDLFDVLLCLSDNEFRYLPLWADGNDDGTGGVFDTQVPNLDAASAGIESFGPGRITRGYQDAKSVTDSDMSEIGSSQAISTVGKASKLATDGTATVKSIASAPSIVNGDHGDDEAGTVVVEHDESETDALSVIHVGEDATGREGDDDADMLGDDNDVDLAYNGDSDEADTVNGDKEMSESLKDFVSGAATTAPAEDMDFDTLDDLSESSFSVEKSSGDTEKGKAKAQNYPYGFHDVNDDEHEKDGDIHSTKTKTTKMDEEYQDENDDDFDFI